jgi:hypothetical protein
MRKVGSRVLTNIIRFALIETEHQLRFRLSGSHPLVRVNSLFKRNQLNRRRLHRTRRHDYGTLDEVLQFADIARPVMDFQGAKTRTHLLLTSSKDRSEREIRITKRHPCLRIWFWHGVAALVSKKRRRDVLRRPRGNAPLARPTVRSDIRIRSRARRDASCDPHPREPGGYTSASCRRALDIRRA